MKELAAQHLMTNLGFEPKEAKIYLSLLELGEASVLDISRKSKINRASIYYIVEKMKAKGVVTHLTRRGGDTYNAVDPSLLYASRRKYLKDFEAHIPELRGLVNKSGQRPSVRFFEGVEGVKAVYSDTLNSKTEILNYANSQEVRSHWPEYDTEYVLPRTLRKIHLRGIAPDDAYGRKVQADDKHMYREIRLIDTRKMNFGNEIMIYDDKIAMVSFQGEIFGVIIESKPLADTQRAIFEMAWGFAAKRK